MKLQNLLNEEKEEHITPEIKKLKEATINGDTTIHQELLQNHPQIFDATPTTRIDISLHLSCLTSKKNFVKHVFKINPMLAKLKNSHGFVPLHVASLGVRFAAIRICFNEEWPRLGFPKKISFSKSSDFLFNSSTFLISLSSSFSN